MMNMLITKALRRARPLDEGYALLVVVGAIAVLTILVTAAYAFSSQTLMDVKRASSTEQAFQAAEAGSNKAWTLVSSGVLPKESLVTTTVTGSTASGTYVVHFSQVATGGASTGDKWEVISVGTYAGVTQTVTAQFAEKPTYTATLWNGFAATGDVTQAEGTLIHGSSIGTSFWGPVYTNNAFLNSYSKAPLGYISALPQAAAPGVVWENGVWVHTSPGKNTDVATHVGTGPVNLYCPVAPTNPANYTTMGFAHWSSTVPTVAFPDYTLSDLQADFARSLRIPSTATTPTALDNAKNPVVVNATGVKVGATQYTDNVKTFSDSHGSFSWDKVNKILTASGMVYIDGDFTSNAVAVAYTGNATIIVNGKNSIGRWLPKNGQATMNSAPWDPLSLSECIGMVSTDELHITAPASLPWTGYDTCTDYKGNFWTAGAFLCTGKFFFESGKYPTRFKGNTVCVPKANGSLGIFEVLQFNYVVADPAMVSYLPWGMPGNVTVSGSQFTTASPAGWSRQ
jgi:hypothetical protein